MTDESSPDFTETKDEVQVLGPFSNEWSSVGTQSGEQEAGEGRAFRLGAGLQGELAAVLGAERLIVVAGSGVSFGLWSRESDGSVSIAPSMSALWREASSLDSFEKIREQLSSRVLAATPVNLEHVLSDAQARLDLDPGASDLRQFVEDAERLILRMCSFVNDSTALETHELFLRKVARRASRLQRTQVFTTNYDLAFEFAAAKSLFNVVDGFGFSGRRFDGSYFDLDFVRRRTNEPLSLEPNVFHLLKLHGSVDWDGSGADLRKTESTPQRPVLIYPSATKYQLSFQQPYLEFMSRFQIALREPDVGLIVVGFGFNDEHLNSPIRSAVRSNSGLRAVFVSPDIRDPQRSSSFEWFESLVRNGDRRLTLLKGTFEDLVRELPDVPDSEERHEHMLRAGSSGEGFGN